MYIDTASDELLWQAFKDGDKAVYAYIYTRYFHVLFSYGKKITPDEDLVQDCIQDLFIELLNRRQNLGATDSIKYYLFKALRRKITHLLLKKHASLPVNTLTDDQLFEDIYHAVHPYEYELITEQAFYEQKKQILQALDFLTKSQKKAIQLKFYQNLSYPEIAAAMSIHVDSVYNLISKATSLLKKNIKKVYLLLVIIFIQ